VENLLQDITFLGWNVISGFPGYFSRGKENPGFVGHPADTKVRWASKLLYLPKTALRHKLFAIAKNDALRP